MRGRAGILSPRRDPEVLDDLAERTPFIAGQRVCRRRAGRRLSTRLRRLAVAPALALLAGVLLLSAHWLLSSPRFAVTQAEIVGLDELTEAEVRVAAGIEAGQNLFTLDGEAVARRLERLPRVKRARVVRVLPDRVRLVIEERRPFALAAAAGRLYWVDEEGRLLGPVARAVAPALPVITGLEDRGAVAGRIRPAVGVLRAILRTGSPLVSRLSEVDVGGAGGPVLYTTDGIAVRLGGEAWEERLGRLEGVLAQLQAEPEPVESIDLRFRDQVVLKLKE